MKLSELTLANSAVNIPLTINNDVKSGLLPAMQTALVCGAGNFIGGRLVTDLKDKGFWESG